MSSTVASREALVDAPPRARRRSRLLRPLLMAGGVVVVVLGAGYYWLTGGTIVDIDDSYLEAAKLSVSTDVSGIVQSVPVHDGEVVQKGQVLLQLDPLKFQIAVDGAKADLAAARLIANAAKLDYQRMQKDIGMRDAAVQGDQADFNRFAALIKGGGVTKQEYDTARFKLAADQQALDGAKVAAQVQLAKLGGDANIDVDSMPSVMQAAARLAEAERELRHATIRAPFAGIVTQVDQTQPGMYLAAANAAFGLVSTTDVWVQANPKETELTWVQPGDKVSVTVDTYPGRTWDGTVESIAPASGNEFSVLPAQNSSGNWVKVVQRIAVRIRVPQKPGEPQLRAGMSVEAAIDTGHHRHLSDLF